MSRKKRGANALSPNNANTPKKRQKTHQCAPVKNEQAETATHQEGHAAQAKKAQPQLDQPQKVQPQKGPQLQKGPQPNGVHTNQASAVADLDYDVLRMQPHGPQPPVPEAAALPLPKIDDDINVLNVKLSSSSVWRPQFSLHRSSNSLQNGSDTR